MSNRSSNSKVDYYKFEYSDDFNLMATKCKNWSEDGYEFLPRSFHIDSRGMIYAMFEYNKRSIAYIYESIISDNINAFTYELMAKAALGWEPVGESFRVWKNIFHIFIRRRQQEE